VEIFVPKILSFCGFPERGKRENYQVCSVPYCVQQLCTVVECTDLRDIRAKYFTVCSVRELFETIANHTIIAFIKESHFYHQL